MKRRKRHPGAPPKFEALFRGASNSTERKPATALTVPRSPFVRARRLNAQRLAAAMSRIMNRMRQEDSEADSSADDAALALVQGHLKRVVSAASAVSVDLHKRIRLAQRGEDGRASRLSVEERLLVAPRTRKARNEDLTGLDARRRGWKRSTWNDYMKEWVKQDEQCVLHVEFRKKFRLPIKLFLPLLEKTRESENFPNDNAPKPGAPPVPLHLKLMATLRVMALGCSFEGVEEAACVSSSIIRVFSLGWWDWFVCTQYDMHVHPPRTVDEVRAAEALFRRLPFPGTSSRHFPRR